MIHNNSIYKNENLSYLKPINNPTSIKTASIFSQFSSFYDASKQFFTHSVDKAKLLKNSFPDFLPTNWSWFITRESCLTHRKMVKIYNEIYHTDSQGICHGFAKVGQNAILSLRLDEFEKKFQKLKAILSLHKTEKDLVILVKKIKEDPELLIFFQDIHEKGSVTSLKEESLIGNSSGIYKPDTLKEHYKNLENLFQELLIKKPIAMFIMIHNWDITDHAVTIGYNPTQKTWDLIDVNLSDNSTVIPRNKTIEEILESLFRMYSNNESLTISSEIFSLANQKQSEKYSEKFADWKHLKEYKSLHNPNSKSLEEKNSWILAAAHLRDVTTMQELLSAGASIHATSGSGGTLLGFASQLGCIELVGELIAAGADVNAANEDGITPLLVASQNGHLEIVTKLIDAGADLTKAHKDGTTPLRVASLNRRIKIIKKLISI